MAVKFNESLLLWAVGVLQPASPEEVISFLRSIYRTVDRWPSMDWIHEKFETWSERQWVLRVNKRLNIYSLSIDGNSKLGAALRRSRDKARLTLLRAAYDATLKQSVAGSVGSGGDAPPSETRYPTQEVSRPSRSGHETSRTESTRLMARPCWPRVIEQLDRQVGLNLPAAGSVLSSYRYYSFPTLASIKEASQDASPDEDLSVTQLGLCIGISGRLITALMYKPKNHYRKFEIDKKGGGFRKISAPRYFLKSIQYWLKDYLLHSLRVHDACHAFQVGRSIITNAERHVGHEFVGNIDIRDFFGSITQPNIEALLIGHGIGERLANTVSRLVTLEGSLPQGAPTSPALSNAYLLEFDIEFSEYCSSRGLVYTRYADDLTISGATKSKVFDAIEQCRRVLRPYQLNLKEEKTRIASKYSCQSVTGIVVNEKLQPPRKFRKKVRAIFHNADLSPSSYVSKVEILRGYYGYLNAFPEFSGSKTLKKYKAIIEKINSLR